MFGRKVFVEYLITVFNGVGKSGGDIARAPMRNKIIDALVPDAVINDVSNAFVDNDFNIVLGDRYKN